MFRYWIATINNPAYPPEVLWDKCQRESATWCKGQLEQGQSGTRHYQCVIGFARTVKLGKLKKIDSRGHYEPSRSDAADGYVVKEDTRIGQPFEFGSKPRLRGAPKTKQTVAELAGKSISDLGGELAPNQFNAAIRALNIYTLHTQDRFGGPRTAIWIVGKPRVGKSRYVKSFNPYYKAQNKWWDGYSGESDVLIDDFDKHGQCLSHYLKLWADPYGELTGEIKGGTIPLNFQRLWVTSNFTIDELFWEEQSPQVAEAINARFTVWEF